jgi:hypothetical protein
LVSLLGLAACDVAPVVDPIPTPRARPDNLRPAPVAPPTRGHKSRALEVSFNGLQQDLLIQGLLRRDGGGPDVRFTKNDLVRDFLRIAMFDEFAPDSVSLVTANRANKLRRWDQPVRIGMQFGATVDPLIESQDRRFVQNYTSRLARITGHSITSASNPNFHILVMNEDDRLLAGPQLRRLLPNASAQAISTIVNMPASVQCLVVSRGRNDPASGTQTSVAVIRAELPALLRQSCYHEEMAQGLGLTNDSDAARPSIFNDDDEFAYLTTHDEMLLRILYDPRLRSGMSYEQVAPTIKVIAAEMFGGAS